MIRSLIFLSVVVVLAGSCLKTDKTGGCPYSSATATAPQAEQDSVRAFLDSNHLVGTKHPKGFYYEIVTPGTRTDTMTLCTQITISYSGQLRDGTEFDRQTDYKFVLGTLVDGWKLGIPMIGKGGRIKLYVPPSLGYGNNDIKNQQGAIVIPAKSILIFDISLSDYTNEN